MSHIFGAKKETVLVPYLTEFTLCLVTILFARKLLIVASFHKNFIHKSWGEPL